MQPDGAGALAVAFEQLKARLAGEGLFDAARKKPIPRYPFTIGVITSQTGAVIRDIINVLSRRWPAATLKLRPAAVQGAGAELSLIEGLRELDGNCDVVIIARGGGSAEDLQAFNSEALAWAIASMTTPVISAVGHETDYTICDFVADLRAPTPSAAAELAAPDVSELMERLAATRLWLGREVRGMLDSLGEELDRLSGHPALGDPASIVKKKREKIDFLAQRLYNNKKRIFDAGASAVANRARLLDSLSPLRVLERGYTAAFKGTEPVTKAAGLEAGDRITLRFRDGQAETEIRSTTLWP
jgi:exodeoxyribonuclease VII large subunit